MIKSKSEMKRLAIHDPIKTADKLIKAIEVIRFYADDEWDVGCGCCSGAGVMLEDLGKKARAFLKELGE